MKTRIYPALGAMFVTLAFLGPAAADVVCPEAQDGVPFHGTLRGAETDVPTFPTLSADGSGTGNATHLGKFQASWLITVNISTTPSPSTGTFEFIAADGSRLFTEVVGEGSGAPLAHITECNTITGGTGRFAGASGAFAIHRVVDLATGDTSGSFGGTIVIHAPK